MPIDYHAALSYRAPEVPQHYAERDTILYALGVGVGLDPVDERELRFVYEEGLSALPTMAAVLGNTPFRELGLDVNYLKVLHGEQSIVIHRPLPSSGTIVGRTVIRDIIDRGTDKGAIIYLDRQVSTRDSGELLATVSMGAVCRGDGGFGGPIRPSPVPHALPLRAADATCDLPTSAQTALIYRLSGDYNPLHIDPSTALRAGFPRPILHGLATFGVVGRALLKLMCDYDPDRLRSMAGRFSAPVFPGEIIRTELWRDGDTVSFRASVPARATVVLNNGRAQIA